MTFAILTLAVLSFLAIGWTLRSAIAHDGYGSRPAPRSHVFDAFEAGAHHHDLAA